jgi:nitrous oxidase accessory protein NosD
MKANMKTQRIRTTKVAVAALIVIGSAASAADIHVPGDYTTIQAAVVNAADDDTIHIASGVYKEQVQIISRKLTLIGQPGTILRATEQLSPFSGFAADQFPVMGVQSSQLTVRGLTFEGERLAGQFAGPGALQGIYFRESSINVENCAFYGFRESVPGSEEANAITGVSVEDDAVNVRVVGCTFADNYTGVFLVGSPTNRSIDVTIENNTFVGPGPLDSDFTHTGILIREGVGGRIAGNTISRFSYIGTDAEFPISFGILAINEANYPPEFGILQHLEIEGNTLRDNQVHVAVIKGDGSVVRNNRFQGTAPRFLPLGLAVSGTNVTIAINQFENMEEGIRLFGNDPNFGTLVGIAVDAQVTSNRFCEVATPINRQSLASAIQTGTLTNSCSTNALAITPAVLVSWPVGINLWTVESATDVTGPWAASSATPFVQYGRHNIAVPTDGERRFFRLR